MRDVVGDAKAIVILNTASKDEQAEITFKKLQQLYQAYDEYGLKILAFPSDQFSTTFTWYEYSYESDIKNFVTSENIGATFPVFQKVSLKGSKVHPLFKWLQNQAGVEIKENFGKFLLDKNGRIINYLDGEIDVMAFMLDIYVLLED